MYISFETIEYYANFILVDSNSGLFFFYTGVDSVSLTDEDYEMADKLFTFEAKAFLKLLDNLIERGNLVIKDNDIKKTG